MAKPKVNADPLEAAKSNNLLPAPEEVALPPRAVSDSTRAEGARLDEEQEDETLPQDGELEAIPAPEAPPPAPVTTWRVSKGAKFSNGETTVTWRAGKIVASDSVSPELIVRALAAGVQLELFAQPSAE